jgi:hypothetical protein
LVEGLGFIKRIHSGLNYPKGSYLRYNCGASQNCGDIIEDYDVGMVMTEAATLTTAVAAFVAYRTSNHWRIGDGV